MWFLIRWLAVLPFPEPRIYRQNFWNRRMSDLALSCGVDKRIVQRWKWKTEARDICVLICSAALNASNCQPAMCVLILPHLSRIKPNVATAAATDLGCFKLREKFWNYLWEALDLSLRVFVEICVVGEERLKVKRSSPLESSSNLFLCDALVSLLQIEARWSGCVCVMRLWWNKHHGARNGISQPFCWNWPCMKRRWSDMQFLGAYNCD